MTNFSSSTGDCCGVVPKRLPMRPNAKGIWKFRVLWGAERLVPLSAVRKRAERMRTWIVLASLIALGGCTDTADVFPMNAAAKDLGPVKVTFVRTGTGRGPVSITMSDGEVLTGEYRVAFGSSVGMAFSGTSSASAIVIGDGPVQFVATGPKTQMLCRGTSTPMGHGNGQCQTYDGAVWTMSW
jgi:hypothetical protein